MATLPKALIRLNAVSIKILMSLFTEIEKSILHGSTKDPE
jgi:hypothetical protein